MEQMAADGRRYWGGVLQPLWPERSEKPRTSGLTMVIDKGLGLRQTGDLLEVAGDYIDFLKLGFGTAALYPPNILREKVALCRAAAVDVLPGGTFFEYAAAQGAIDRWLRQTADFGFTAVEISEGSLALPAGEREQAIRQAQSLGFRVLTEVGRKDPTMQPTPEELQQQAIADLALGVDYVIVEGRESGRGIGVFDGAGAVREDELTFIWEGLGEPDRLIWEAPLKDQQIWLLLHLGCNVSLGNIAPTDVLALEAQRRGLRGDTLPAALAHTRLLPRASMKSGRMEGSN